MTVIVDYGVGNLFSLLSSFAAIGEQAKVSSDKAEIECADRIVLPGVGAFADAACKLEQSGLKNAIYRAVKKGVPIMGVCLGMQLLFDKSYEYGEYDGLKLISGEIRPISDYIPKDLKIPHIGWNALNFKQDSCPIFKYTKEGDHVYFVHSFYAADCDEHTVATTEYGAELTAAVARDNVYGCQFHPEKSGEVGLKILKAFTEVTL